MGSQETVDTKTGGFLNRLSGRSAACSAKGSSATAT